MSKRGVRRKQPFTCYAHIAEYALRKCDDARCPRDFVGLLRRQARRPFHAGQRAPGYHGAQIRIRETTVTGDRRGSVNRPSARVVKMLPSQNTSLLLALGLSGQSRKSGDVPTRAQLADAEHDIAVAGPDLAAQMLWAGLVDEFQMIVCPVIVGGGKRFLPDDMRLDLEMFEERRFGNGVIVLRYAVRR